MPLASKGGLHRKPMKQFAIPGLNILADAVLTAGLTNWEQGGIYADDGAGNNVAGLATLNASVDSQGRLLFPPFGVAALGEWYNGVVADYSASVVASRVLRSDLMVEFAIQTITSDQLYLCTFNPSLALPVTQWRVNTSTNDIVETAAGLGAVAGPFTAQADSCCQKILISARRIAAGQKDYVISWYDRATATVLTSTVNHVAGGVGDAPLMWQLRLGAVDGYYIKSFATGDFNSPLTYGAIPV